MDELLTLHLISRAPLVLLLAQFLDFPSSSYLFQIATRLHLFYLLSQALLECFDRGGLVQRGRVERALLTNCKEIMQLVGE